MELIRNTTWEEVFSGWRSREAGNPAWVHCATQIKGWADWESWRRFTAKQINAENREWQIFKFSNPLDEIPQMLIGPYSGWQSKVQKKNETTFAQLLDIPEQYEHFSKYEPVKSILQGLPFSTEFIGFVREDVDKVVCFEGHHRATAVALAKRDGLKLDFSNCNITIALSRVSSGECYIFDEVLKRGTSYVRTL